MKGVKPSARARRSRARAADSLEKKPHATEKNERLRAKTNGDGDGDVHLCVGFVACGRKDAATQIHHII